MADQQCMGTLFLDTKQLEKDVANVNKLLSDLGSGANFDFTDMVSKAVRKQLETIKKAAGETKTALQNVGAAPNNTDAFAKVTSEVQRFQRVTDEAGQSMMQLMSTTTSGYDAMGNKISELRSRNGTLVSSTKDVQAATQAALNTFIQMQNAISRVNELTANGRTNTTAYSKAQVELTQATNAWNNYTPAVKNAVLALKEAKTAIEKTGKLSFEFDKVSAQKEAAEIDKLVAKYEEADAKKVASAQKAAEQQAAEAEKAAAKEYAVRQKMYTELAKAQQAQINELVKLYQQYYTERSKEMKALDQGNQGNYDLAGSRAKAIWEEIAAIEAEHPELAKLAGEHEKVTAAARKLQEVYNNSENKYAKEAAAEAEKQAAATEAAAERERSAREKEYAQLFADIDKATALYAQLQQKREQLIELDLQDKQDTSQYAKIASDVQLLTAQWNNYSEAMQQTVLASTEAQVANERLAEVTQAAQQQQAQKEQAEAVQAYADSLVKLYDEYTKLNQAMAAGKIQEGSQEYDIAREKISMLEQTVSAAGSKLDAAGIQAANGMDKVKQAALSLEQSEAKLASASEVSALDKAQNAYNNLTTAIRNYNIAKKAGNQEGMAYWTEQVNGAMNVVSAIESEVGALQVDEATRERILSLIAQSKTQQNAFTQGVSDSASGMQQFGMQINSLVTRMFSLVTIMRTISNVWKDATSYVTEYYDQMNEIRIITNKSQDEADKLGQKYRDIAKEMSVSSNDIADAAIYFTRQGLGDNEIEERLKSTTQYAKAANIEFTRAAELITAVVNSMNLVEQEADDGRKAAQRVADVFLKVGDSAATSGEEIGTAMQKAAAAAGAFGMDFEWLAAYIATVSETTRQEATSIGTAFNTLIARLHSIRTTGFNSEDETKINDIQKALNNLGITLLDQDGQWRDMTDIFNEIAAQWDTLDGKTKSYVATTMAGVKQQNVFLALMEDLSKGIENGSRAWELYEIAMDSAGTATQKYEVYAESVTASQERLAEAQEQFYSNLSGEVIKEWNNSLAGFINMINEGTEAFDGWNLIIPIVGTAIIGLVAGFSKLSAALTALNTAHPYLLALTTAAVGIATLVTTISMLGDAVITQSERFEMATATLETSQSHIKTLTTAQSKLSEMLDAVDRSGSNANEVLDDYSDLLSQIASLSPSAKEEVDKLKSSFDGQKSSVEGLNTVLDNMIEKEKKLSTSSLVSKYLNMDMSGDTGTDNKESLALYYATKWSSDWANGETGEAGFANMLEQAFKKTYGHADASALRYMPYDVYEYIRQIIVGSYGGNWDNADWSVIGQQVWMQFMDGMEIGAQDNMMASIVDGWVDDIMQTLVIGINDVDAASTRQALYDAILGGDGNLSAEDYKNAKTNIANFLTQLSANDFNISAMQTASQRFYSFVSQIMGDGLEQYSQSFGADTWGVDFVDPLKLRIEQVFTDYNADEFINDISTAYNELLAAGFSKVDIQEILAGMDIEEWPNMAQEMRGQLFNAVFGNIDSEQFDADTYSAWWDGIFEDIDLALLKEIDQAMENGEIDWEDLSAMWFDEEGALVALDEFVEKWRAFHDAVQKEADKDTGEIVAEDYGAIVDGIKAKYKTVEDIDTLLTDLQAGKSVNFDDYSDLLKEYPQLARTMGNESAFTSTLKSLREKIYGEEILKSVVSLYANDKNFAFTSRYASKIDKDTPTLKAYMDTLEEGSDEYNEVQAYLEESASKFIRTVINMGKDTTEKTTTKSMKELWSEVDEFDGVISKLRSATDDPVDFEKLFNLATTHPELLLVIDDTNALIDALTKLRSASVEDTIEQTRDMILDSEELYKNSAYYDEHKGYKTLRDYTEDMGVSADVVNDIYDYIDQMIMYMYTDAGKLNQVSQETIGAWMTKAFNNGNVDLLHRPQVNLGDGEYATVDTRTYTAGSDGVAWNQNLVLNVTPILPDGTVMSDTALNAYIEKLLANSNDLEDILMNDAVENGGRGVVIGGEAGFSDAEFEGKITEYTNLAQLLHLLQEAYYGVQEAEESWLQTKAKENEKNANENWAATQNYTQQLDEMASALSDGGIKSALAVWNQYTSGIQDGINSNFPSLISAMAQAEQAQNNLTDAQEKSAEAQEKVNEAQAMADQATPDKQAEAQQALADANEKAADAAEKVEQATQKAAEAQEQLNAAIAKEQQYNQTKYFKDATKAAKDLHNGTIDVAEAYDKYDDAVDKALKAQEDINNVEAKKKKGKELKASDVNDLADLLGISANDILADWDSAVEQFNAITSAGGALEQVLRAINEEAFIKIVGTSDVDFSDLENGLVTVESLGEAAVAQLLETGKFEVQTKELNYKLWQQDGDAVPYTSVHKGSVDIVVPKGTSLTSNTGSGNDNNDNTSGGGGGGGSSGNTASDNVSDLEDNLDAYTHRITMIQSEQTHYQRTNDWDAYNKSLDEEITAQKALQEQYQANIDELLTLRASTTEGSDDWNTYTQAIYEAEEALAEISETIDELNAKKLTALEEQIEQENKGTTHTKTMVETQTERYSAAGEKEFTNYRRSVRKEINLTQSEIDKNKADIKRYQALLKNYTKGSDEYNETKDKINELKEANAEKENEILTKQNALNEAIITNIQNTVTRGNAKAGQNMSLAQTYGGIYSSLGQYGKYRQTLNTQNTSYNKQIKNYQAAIDQLKKEMKGMDKTSDAWYKARDAVYEYQKAIASATASIEQNKQALQQSRLDEILNKYSNAMTINEHIAKMYGYKETEYGNDRAYGAQRVMIGREKGVYQTELTKLQNEENQLWAQLAKMTKGTDAYNNTWKEILSVREQQQEKLSAISAANVKTVQSFISEWKAYDDLTTHDINLLKTQETGYQNKGELTNYGIALKAENDLQKELLGKYQDHLTTMIRLRDSYEEGSQEWNEANDEILTLEQSIATLNNTYDQNNKKLKENAENIRKVAQTMENELEKEYKARDTADRNRLSARVSMENEILEALKDSYQEQWDLLKEDIQNKKDALNAEKNLLSERLNARKKAMQDEEQYEQLAEMQKQLALLSADPTRSKEAKELRARIAEMQQNIAWGIAEDEVAADQARIDDEIKAWDDYVSIHEQDLNDMLNNANNFAEQVAEIMKLGEDEILEWLSSNSDKFKDSLKNAQDQQLQTWDDTWKKMHDITTTYWAEIAATMQSRNAFLDFMMDSDTYRNASDSKKESLRYQWEEMWDKYRSSTSVDVNAGETTRTAKDIEEALKNSSSSLLQEATKYVYTVRFDDVGQDATNYKTPTAEKTTGGAHKTVKAEDTGDTDTKQYHSTVEWTVYNDKKKKLKSGTGTGESTVKATAIKYARSDAKEAATAYKNKTKNAKSIEYGKSKTKYYLEGGLADYTGFAWIDGSPMKPESFLDAQDTKILSSLMNAMNLIWTSGMSHITPEQYSNRGATAGEIKVVINQAELKDDADYEEVARRVGQAITKQMTKQGLTLTRYNY